MLATCSNILQLWNSENYSLISEFGHDHVPSTDTIRCVDWKKDNSNYLVFTYKQTGRVQLYDIQKNKSVELAATRVQCCSFSQSGKYLTVTNEECQAHIWDVNSGRICQTFASIDQTPMECLCWGNGDSYIAAGTRKGNVFLYNQLTKQTFAAFTTKNNNKISSITSIKWSPHKDLLATSSADGLLSLWNSRLKELIVSLHSHKAPSTDLSFSPQNDAFLVSAGMDGSLCCFDVIKQKNLSTITVYSPLTSVDFHSNGFLVAVGTMGQSASIYDLRDPKTKVSHLVNSEHGNVYSVRFDGNSSTNTSNTSNNTNRTTMTINTGIDSSISSSNNRSMSTFAQQTSRSRHPSSSNLIENNSSSFTLPRRERSLSNSSNQPLNQNETNQTTIVNQQRPNANVDEEMTSLTQGRMSRVQTKETNHQRSMSFDQFTRLCGVSKINSNGDDDSTKLDQRIQKELDQRFDSLREDFESGMNQMKLSMQMYILIQLEKVKNELSNKIESNSINEQLIDEIRRLREENQMLRQIKPNL